MASSESKTQRGSGADDPLIPSPGKPPSPLLFSSREQIWPNIFSLWKRFMTTALSLALLGLSLVIFSRKGPLTKWEQRAFNTITILLSAIASLGLGAMLGYLGSMIRWPLLARRKHKMRDVELVLGMPSPSGSLKLIYRHVREWRASRTTLVVALYLIANLSGRFSVAIFGLTYNLANRPGTDHPVFVTNWESSVLASRKHTSGSEDAKNERQSYLDLVEGGLASLTRRPELDTKAAWPNVKDRWQQDLAVRGVDLTQKGKEVEFSYRLNDFKETNAIPSGRSVHSTTSCTMLRLLGDRYWRGYNGSEDGFSDWTDPRNQDGMANVLRALNNSKAWPKENHEWVTWASLLNPTPRPVSSKTFIVYNHTGWECDSTLTERIGTGDQNSTTHPHPLFNSTSLFLLPVSENEALGQQAAPPLSTSRQKITVKVPETYMTTAVRRTTSSDRKSKTVFTTTSTGYVTRTLISTGYRTSYIHKIASTAGGSASVSYRWFAETSSRTCPSVGVNRLDFYRDSAAGQEEQKDSYNLYVASLVARLPIVAIAYANTDLPRIPRDQDARRKEYVTTTLEVKWLKVTLAAAAIVIGQLLAIVMALYYCWGVPIREDSHLATAELLKNVLNKYQKGSFMKAAELAKELDNVLKGPVSYGMVEGEQPRVDLARDVSGFSPSGPAKRRTVPRR